MDKQHTTTDQLEHDKEDPLNDHYDFPDSEMLNVSIAQSSLPCSGMGLRAISTIHNHEIIAEYYGSIIDASHSMDREFATEDKMVQIDH